MQRRIQRRGGNRLNKNSVEKKKYIPYDRVSPVYLPLMIPWHRICCVLVSYPCLWIPLLKPRTPHGTWDLRSGNTLALDVSSAPYWHCAGMHFTSRLEEVLNFYWTAPPRILRTFFVAYQNVTLADWNAKISINLALHLRVYFSSKRIKLQQVRGCIIKEEKTCGECQLKLQGLPSSCKLHMRFLKLLVQKGLQCCSDSWPHTDQNFMLSSPQHIES